jgi:hypothetical protein
VLGVLVVGRRPRVRLRAGSHVALTNFNGDSTVTRRCGVPACRGAASGPGSDWPGMVSNRWGHLGKWSSRGDTVNRVSRVQWQKESHCRVSASGSTRLVHGLGSPAFSG